MSLVNHEEDLESKKMHKSGDLPAVSLMPSEGRKINIKNHFVPFILNLLQYISRCGKRHSISFTASYTETREGSPKKNACISHAS